jgi:hypothetical protein
MHQLISKLHNLIFNAVSNLKFILTHEANKYLAAISTWITALCVLMPKIKLEELWLFLKA